jgi:hypothetical protein
VPRRPLDLEVTRARRRRDRLAAQLAAEDAALAALLKAQRELLEAVGEFHRNEVLHNPHRSSKIIDTMDAETAVRGAPLETKHIGAKKMREVDGSIARFAAKHRVAATTVRSWYATGEAAREIPRRFAELLAKPPYSIAVTAWRNGVSE